MKGICSFYYESNENLSENLIIRINSIFAIDDYQKHITMMLNFIKNKVKYNRLEVYILYDKVENNFIPNKEAKELFHNVDFKWMCVVRDQKLQQRYIKLYYSKEEEYETDDDNQKTQNNFVMNNLSIITVNNEANSYTLKNIINNRSDNNGLKKTSYNKFINPYPLYALISENSRIKKEFLSKSKENELKEMKDKLWRFVIAENDWNLIENEKKKIKDIQFNLKDTISHDIENYFMAKEIRFSFDLFQTKLSINFESNYSILIDDIYYNKISTDKIKILKEKKTNSIFFLIPSYDNTAFFYVAKVNRKLKDLLIDNNKNIYENFLEFQPSTQKELYDFSTSSFRDFTYIPQTFKKKSETTIYIPTFSIDAHLFSYDFKEVKKNVKMTDKESNTDAHLNSVDEFVHIEFKPDKNIDNSFSVIPVIGGTNDILINDSFIIGIFDNDIINNNILPLLQILYITKDHFLTKNNFFP